MENPPDLPAAFTVDPDSGALWGAFLLAHGFRDQGTYPTPQGFRRTRYLIGGAPPSVVAAALKSMVAAANAARLDPREWAAYKFQDHGDTTISVRVA